MQPTQTGIAVALALAVVIFFFVFGGMSFFATPTSPDETSLEAAAANATTNQTTSTTMPTENTTQLQITDEIIGTGAAAATGDSVTVNYVGSFTNGTIFDASANHGTTGFTFNLGAGQVIKGWDDGIVGMKEGGKRRLIVPASLGYGPNDYGPIPGNSTLIFEVELLKVQKP
jgi:FKBP-type peptidyl-prolyl cis-trans isomerase